jgi:hypothetical protein
MRETFIRSVKKPVVPIWESVSQKEQQPFSFWEGFAHATVVSVPSNMGYLLHLTKENQRRLLRLSKRWAFNMW